MCLIFNLFSVSSLHSFIIYALFCFPLVQLILMTNISTDSWRQEGLVLETQTLVSNRDDVPQRDSGSRKQGRVLARLFRIGTAKPISASIKRSEREQRTGATNSAPHLFLSLSRFLSLSPFNSPLLHRLASSHPSFRSSPPLPSLLWPSHSRRLLSNAAHAD